MSRFIAKVNGKDFDIEITEISSAEVPQAAAPTAAPAATVQAAPATQAAAPVANGSGVKISAPMPGTILEVKVSAGQAVKRGQVVCVLEAMKMENDIVAPQDGTIASITVSKGASVNSGDVLAQMA